DPGIPLSEELNAVAEDPGMPTPEELEEFEAAFADSELQAPASEEPDPVAEAREAESEDESLDRRDWGLEREWEPVPPRPPVAPRAQNKIYEVELADHEATSPEPRGTRREEPVARREEREEPVTRREEP